MKLVDCTMSVVKTNDVEDASMMEDIWREDEGVRVSCG